MTKEEHGDFGDAIVMVGDFTSGPIDYWNVIPTTEAGDKVIDLRGPAPPLWQRAWFHIRHPRRSILLRSWRRRILPGGNR